MNGTRHLDPHSPARSLRLDQQPLIDLAPLIDDNDDPEGIDQLVRKACLDTGFFNVHDSSVDVGHFQRAFDAARSFFALPDDGPVKQAVHNCNANQMKGWGPLFSEPAYQPDTVAHMESFDIGQQLAPKDYQRLGIDPNIWPELDGFRPAVLAAYDELTRIGRALATVFSRLLGEPENFINNHSGPSAPRTMRLLHYPARESGSEMRDVGIAAHTDFECFTLLCQTALGLELTHADGGWCEAPADPRTITVILGDMMERFSNGQFRATGHRVALTPWARYSLVLFFALDGDFSVSPLPRFVDERHPAAYPPITQNDHIRDELERAAANAPD